MEKASLGEEDWEVLSDDGVLGLRHRDENSFFRRESGLDLMTNVDMNHFMCPVSPFHRQLHQPFKSEPQRDRNNLIPMLIVLEPMGEKNPYRESGKLVNYAGEVLEKIENPNRAFDASSEPQRDRDSLISVPVIFEAILEKNPNGESGKDVGEVRKKFEEPHWASDEDAISQIFFKKMKDHEFVDMKMDLPWSSGKGLKPQIDLGAAQFEQKEGECYEGENLEHKLEMHTTNEVEENKDCSEGGGMNILGGWRVAGRTILCSVGMAAAAVCIIIFGRNKRQEHQNLNQQLRFQIYADDKSMKRVVHRGTKLGHTLSAVKGISGARPQITFEGHWDYGA